MMSNYAPVVRLCHNMLVMPCHITALPDDVTKHTHRILSCDRGATYVSLHKAFNPLGDRTRLYQLGTMTDMQLP